MTVTQARKFIAVMEAFEVPRPPKEKKYGVYLANYPNAFIPGFLFQVAENDTGVGNCSYKVKYYEKIEVIKTDTEEIVHTRIGEFLAPKYLVEYLSTDVGFSMLETCIKEYRRTTNSVGWIQLYEFGFFEGLKEFTFFAAKGTPEGNLWLRAGVGRYLDLWLDMGPIKDYKAGGKKFHLELLARFPDTMLPAVEDNYIKKINKPYDIPGGIGKRETSMPDCEGPETNGKLQPVDDLKRDGDWCVVERQEYIQKEGEYSCSAVAPCAALSLYLPNNSRIKKKMKDLYSELLKNMTTAGKTNREREGTMRQLIGKAFKLRIDPFVARDGSTDFDPFTSFTKHVVWIKIIGIKCIHHLCFYKGWLIEPSCGYPLKVSLENLNAILGKYKRENIVWAFRIWTEAEKKEYAKLLKF